MDIRKFFLSIPFFLLSAHPSFAFDASAPVLEELHFTSQSSARLPYYSIIKDGNSYLCRISPEKDELRDRYSEVRVPGDEVESLLSRLISLGVLTWDGYEKSVPRPSGMLDGDDFFSFSLKLRNDRTVKAQGSRARPEGFREAHKALMEFFEAHQDYSRYYPESFPAEAPCMLEIEIAPEFGSRYTQLFKLSLSTGRESWAVMLRDPRGEYLPKDVAVSGYGEAVKDLPLRKFVRLLSKYGFEGKNRTRIKTGPHSSRIHISMHWSGDREYIFDSNEDFEQRDAFIREFLDMAQAYYAEVK